MAIIAREDRVEIDHGITAQAAFFGLLLVALSGVVVWAIVRASGTGARLILGAGVVLFLPMALVFLAAHRVIIDRVSRTVQVCTKSIFGTRRRVHSFEELSDVAVDDRLVQSSRYSPAHHLYSLSLVTRSGEIPLHSTRDVEEHARLLREVRRVTGLESRAMKIVHERLQRRGG